MPLHHTTNDALLTQLAIAGHQFDLWVADPPWTYAQTGGGDPTKFRSTAKRVYACQTYADIAATLQRAAAITNPDGVLCLWVTAPLLSEIFRAVIHPLETWGAWRYMGSIYWRKTGAPGIGQWMRGDVEQLLILSRSGKLPVHLRGQTRKGSKAECFRNHIEDIETHDSKGRGKEMRHSEKPAGLEEKVIRRFCPPGGRVGSLWSGTYPTGRACRALGLECHGAEVDLETWRASSESMPNL